MRFNLRKFRKGDEASLQRNVNHKEIAANTALIPYPYTMKHARQWIKHNLLEQTKRNKTSVVFVIDYKGEVIGNIGLSNINKKDNNAELGYWLGKAYWGKGIVTKAVQQVVAYGFKKLKLKRIYAKAYLSNKGSQRVLEKAGFRHEGILRKAAKKHGKYLDCHLYAKINLKNV